jgi:hypothetical protein
MLASPTWEVAAFSASSAWLAHITVAAQMLLSRKVIYGKSTAAPFCNAPAGISQLELAGFVLTSPANASE